MCMIFRYCLIFINFCIWPMPIWAETHKSCQSLFIVEPQIGPQKMSHISDFLNLIIKIKSISEEFKIAFSFYNENEKKLTIEDHVVDVFSQYLLEKDKRTISLSFQNIMPMAIALHDIGKPKAIINGRRDLQHLWTIPMVVEFLTKIGWDVLDIKKCIALISFSGFGELAQRQKSAYEVFVEIDKISQELKVTPWEFYRAKKAFYLSDAGSYSQLRNTVFFERTNKTLYLRNFNFLELEYWLTESLK